MKMNTQLCEKMLIQQKDTLTAADGRIQTFKQILYCNTFIAVTRVLNPWEEKKIISSRAQLVRLVKQMQQLWIIWCIFQFLL